MQHGEVEVAASTPTPPLRADELLVGRYLLLAPVPGPGPALVWRAFDEVLARPVAVTSLSADDPAAGALLDAARRSGVVLHPGVARVHDAAVGGRGSGAGEELAYVISEWVDGQSLDTLLGEGPLEPRAAVGLLRQAADALSALHAHGFVHGRLHPGNVLVTTAGRLKITPTGGSAPANREAVRRDTRDLAAVLFALLTARWPATATDQPARRLPAAPLAAGRPLRPGQVRAGVPRQLDTLVTAALDPLAADRPELATPAALAGAVEAAAKESWDSRVSARPAGRGAELPGGSGLGSAAGRWSASSPDSLPMRHQRTAGRPAAADGSGARPVARSRLRRAAPWLGLLVLVGVVGATGWLFGQAVGELPRRDDAIQAIVSTLPAPAPGTRPVRPATVDLAQLPVRDFDPLPGDGRENPDTVRNAVDGDPSTAWSTSTYTTADFGRLKAGLGLLVDLGSSRSLSRVQVGLTAAGASVQLRCSDEVGAAADSFRTVAQQRDAGQVATLRPAAGARGRYWLVWLTGLPRAGNGFRVGVAELRFS